MSPITVRKALISSFGSVSNINVVSASLPDPPTLHVQVRIIYSGFSGADIAMRQGTYPLQKKPPLTPGYSLVGTVSSNGKRSSKFQPGDIVACLSIYNAEADSPTSPRSILSKSQAGWIWSKSLLWSSIGTPLTAWCIMLGSSPRGGGCSFTG